MKDKLISSATMPSNIPVAKISHPDEKIRFTFFSLLVFLSAMPSTQVLNIVGELYVTEILLPLLAAIVLFSGKSRVFNEKVFWQFVLVCICMMLGYIVSDIYAGTDSSRYLRAWGRNFILFTDIVALAIILSSDKRLIWWLILGLSTGALLDLILNHVSIVTHWKMGYGRPLIFITIALGYFLSKRITMICLFGLGLLSIFLDSRSMGLLCLLTAGAVFIRINRPLGLKLSATAIFRIIMAGALVLLFALSMLDLTQDEHGRRHEWSNMGRFAAISIAIVAVSESPIVGYGSWGQGTEKFAAQLYDEIAFDLIRSGQQNVKEGKVFHPHSQILQAWMEGGILAAIFFIFFAYHLIFAIKRIVLSRRLDYLTPLYSFSILLSIWNLIMSPYGGNHRLPIAISVTIICMLIMERKLEKNNKESTLTNHVNTTGILSHKVGPAITPSNQGVSSTRT